METILLTLLIVSAGVGLICGFILWFFPRKLVMWTGNSKLYKGVPPPWQSLSKFGKTIQALFYLSGLVLLLIGIASLFLVKN